MLPDEDGTYALYTVKDNHAVKHGVRIGLQDDHDVQVVADDLHEGDPVVVTGNYLLAEGMEVEVKPPATEPTTEPATAPSTHPAASAEPEAKP